MTGAMQLGDSVRIVCSGEIGEVVGIAHYRNSDSALIRYKAADGRAVELWWQFDALEPVL